MLTRKLLEPRRQRTRKRHKRQLCSAACVLHRTDARQRDWRPPISATDRRAAQNEVVRLGSDFHREESAALVRGVLRRLLNFLLACSDDIGCQTGDFTQIYSDKAGTVSVADKSIDELGLTSGTLLYVGGRVYQGLQFCPCGTADLAPLHLVAAMHVEEALELASHA